MLFHYNVTFSAPCFILAMLCFAIEMKLSYLVIQDCILYWIPTKAWTSEAPLAAALTILFFTFYLCRHSIVACYTFRCISWH